MPLYSNGGVNNNFNIDNDGDNVFETQVAPSAVLSGDEARDVTKPTSAIHIDGAFGNGNWRVATTTIKVTAEDNANGAGVLNIEYSLDGGRNWQTYQTPVVLTQSGQYSFQYAATDRAGNREDVQAESIWLDAAGPVVDILQPAADAEYLRNEILPVEYLLSDAPSGVASSSAVITADGQVIAGDIPQIDLFSYPLGEHTIAVEIFDNAGNRTITSVSFTAGASITSTIDDIARAFREGMITRQNAVEVLTKKLQQVQKYIERFGARQEKRQAKLEAAMSRCVAKKGRQWCEQKLGKKLSRVIYRLDRFRQKTIQQDLRSALKQLQAYHQKYWLNDAGYQIIKSDIDWLMETLEKGGEMR